MTLRRRAVMVARRAYCMQWKDNRQVGEEEIQRAKVPREFARDGAAGMATMLGEYRLLRRAEYN